MKQTKIWITAVLLTEVFMVIRGPSLHLRLSTTLYFKNGGRRTKWSLMWDSGTLVTHIWGTFDLVGFKVILGSVDALVSKWFVTRTFDLVGFKVILGYSMHLSQNGL